jgi:putative YhbY family RNA-binding protein
MGEQTAGEVLSGSVRRALKARAHALEPVVIIGDAGLTPPVLREIDRSLTAHELIKIRVAGDDRDARSDILHQVCRQLGASAVQQIGKILVVFRPAPDRKPKPDVRPRAKKPRALKRTFQNRA